jgi:hypothetical protein
MTDEQPRKREGLEGLPINSYEVWGFDTVRAAANNTSDVSAYIACWVAVAVTLALAVWGGSIVLGAIGAFGFVLVAVWTRGKIRRRADARRMRRRVLAQEAADGHDEPHR